MADHPPIPSLPFCQPSNSFLLFLSSQLHTCVPTPLAAISSLLGMLSITAWLFAQLPQIATNFRLKSTSGLSFLFLLNWCLGDSCNLAGAVLLDQMTFQKLIAGYYVIVDAVLILQWSWYTARAAHVERVRLAGGVSKKNGMMAVLSVLFCMASARPTEEFSTRSVMFFNPNEDALHHLGRVLSWGSTVLYLSSRTPQLLLNYKRRSVKGLSPNLFLAAFLGNLFYSTSLLTNPSAWMDLEPYGGGGWVGEKGSVRGDWWWDTLPFFLGAAGVLGMDACVGYQFLLWGENSEPETIDGVPVDVGVKTTADEAKKDGEDKAKKDSEDKAKKDSEDKAKKDSEDKAKKRFVGIQIRRGESAQPDEGERLLGTTLNGGRIYGTYSPMARSIREER